MRIVLFILALMAASPAMALPQCAGGVEVPHAQIVRVERNGVLVLADGRAALLEGIRLPGADGAPAIADNAIEVLQAMALGGELTLTAVRPKEDRYDRIRVQAFGEAAWLQLALLRRGLARVEIAPDRSECAAELYAAEAQAREQRLGLWSLPAFAVRDAVRLKAGTSLTGTFQIVQGRVLNVTIHDGRVFLDFGDDYKNDFTATISPEDKKTFTAMGVDPRDYEGKRVRLRGIVQDYNGPEIELSNPMQVELLQ